MFRRQRKRAADSASADLRRRALAATPDELGITPTEDRPRVYGVLMDIAYPNGTATLVSLADGSTSLYFSSGGGIIGGGEHTHIAQASMAFVATADGFVEAMEPTKTFPAPPPDKVRFQLLTFTGGLTVEADEAELGEQTHPLSPLFYKGQNVITQLRRLEEQQQHG